jgi:hypothetical protein
MDEKETTKKLPIPHYVCTGGCGLVFEDEGRCKVGDCYRYRNPLTECKCKNNKHKKFLTMNVPKGAPLPESSIIKVKKINRPS